MAQPHAHLALATQFADHDCKPQSDMRYWLRLTAGKTCAELPPLLNPPREPIEGFVTGRATAAELERLLASAVVADLELAEPLLVERPLPRKAAGLGKARPASDASPAGAKAPAGKQPVLGIIDTGLPFAHPGVLKGTGAAGRHSTRFLALWDQDPEPDFGRLGWVPQGFGQGAVLNRAAMNRMVRRAAEHEDTVYRLAGCGTVAPRCTHGAHVLGLLAMNVPPVDKALGLALAPSSDELQADIVGVQLPRALLQSPSRAALCSAVLDGLLWMRQVCGQRPLRVVVPYGSTLGPHDGSSLFERALDAVVETAKGQLEVFLPAGNSYELGLHAVLKDTRGTGPYTLKWRVPLGSEAASVVELWAPLGLVQAVEVRAPNGQPSAALTLEDGAAAVGVAGGGAGSLPCIVHTVVPGLNGVLQSALVIRFAPTLVSTSGRLAAASGDWAIHITLSQEQAGEVHAYGSRARGSYGSVVRGQQGRFVTAAGAGWAVDPAGSISGMATGQHARVHVVGAFVNGITRAGLQANSAQGSKKKPQLQVQASHYSSSGPSRGGKGVEMSCAGDQSGALGGVRSAGTRGAISWRMDGSSVAAPQAARLQPQPKGKVQQPKQLASDARLGMIRAPGWEKAGN